MEALQGVAREARALAIAKGLKLGQSTEMSISCKARPLYADLFSLIDLFLGYLGYR